MALETIGYGMKNMRRLRLPLQTALAISPIYLLLNLSLYAQEFDRGALLKVYVLYLLTLQL